MPTDAEAPLPFQFSLKWFPGLWIPQNIFQRFPHFSLHLRIEMTDEVPHFAGNFESSFGQRGSYSPNSSPTV